MNTSPNKYKWVAVWRTPGLAVMLLCATLLWSCDENLPDVGEIEDLTPPEANFSYRSSTDDFKEITFTNLSISSNSYSWDFGDGGTSTDKDPVHIFSGEGTFSVTLTAKDGNDVTSSVSIDVAVVDELVPLFECNSFECADRSVWGSFSGSGSPTPPDGSTGAKLESDSHFLDQTIRVSPGVEYILSFYYVSASSNGEDCGDLLVTDADASDEAAKFIEQAMPLTSNASDYVPATFVFTTGATTQNLRFQLTPGDVTGRYDYVTIVKNE